MSHKDKPIPLDLGALAHPAAALFPMMTGAEYEALIGDLREHGQRQPLVMHQGKILDGRNRWAAMALLGRTPAVVEWQSGGGSPEEFVVSMNLHRRHLNESQRAMIATKIANLKRGQRADNKGENGGDGLIRPLPIAEAAALLKVGTTTVKAAKIVLRSATPAEIAAVDRGEARVQSLAQQIRRGLTAAERAARRNAPLRHVGKNPERIQRQQMRTKLYRDVRDAVLALTGLPRPAEVAAIVLSQDRGGQGDDRRPPRPRQAPPQPVELDAIEPSAGSCAPAAAAERLVRCSGFAGPDAPSGADARLRASEGIFPATLDRRLHGAAGFGRIVGGCENPDQR